MLPLFGRHLAAKGFEVQMQAVFVLFLTMVLPPRPRKGPIFCHNVRQSFRNKDTAQKFCFLSLLTMNFIWQFCFHKTSELICASLEGGGGGSDWFKEVFFQRTFFSGWHTNLARFSNKHTHAHENAFSYIMKTLFLCPKLSSNKVSLCVFA